MATALFDLVPIGASGERDHPPTALELRGEIDITNAGRFQAALVEALSTGPTILDLSTASFVDSAGFAALNRLLSGGALYLVVSPTSSVAKAAKIMGVPHYQDVTSARSAAESGR